VTQGPRGQAVFTSSTAPARKATAHKSANAPVPTTRSAVGDVWSGVASSSSPPTAAAPAAVGEGGSSGPGVIVGIAVLALGLVGLSGGFVVAGRRRRRSAASGRGSTPTTKR
jgi:hypothetical protein